MSLLRSSHVIIVLSDISQSKDVPHTYVCVACCGSLQSLQKSCQILKIMDQSEQQQKTSGNMTTRDAGIVFCLTLLKTKLTAYVISLTD